jgi:hypothetical protein
VAARLKLAGKVVGTTSSTDEIDHLPAKLRRIGRACSWHRQHLCKKLQGVHQTGSIPAIIDLEHFSQAMLLATMAVPVHAHMAVDRTLRIAQGCQRLVKVRLVTLDAHQQGVAGRGSLFKALF